MQNTRVAKKAKYKLELFLINKQEVNITRWVEIEYLS